MTPMADPDPLEELRAQVRATQEAAQRLMDGAVPPRGWDAAGPGAGERPGAFTEEVQALAGVLAALRDVLPPELQRQVSDLIRQVLLVLRAVIDWLVERMERDGAPDAGAAAGPTAAGRVEDIPIS